MNQRVTGNYLYYLTILVSAAVILVSSKSLYSQGYLKAEVRSTNCAVANHEADRWFFGQNAGLNFKEQDPVADLNNFILNIPTSAAVMADSSGKVILFSDGISAYNSQFQVIANGDGLHGFVGYPMPVLIVPKPDSDSIYYIFTTHRPKQNDNDPGPFYGLEYSEVSLTRNGGAGEVTIKNKQLIPAEVSSKLSAVMHSNGKDYWVVAHKFNTDEFFSFPVTANGVDSSGVKRSPVGTIHAGPGSTNNGIGYMKISPDGTKLALAIYGSGIIEVFDFNNSSGIVSSEKTSPPIFDNCYGIEFSPDSKFLYSSFTPIEMPVFTDTILDLSVLLQFEVGLGSSMFSNYDTIASDTMGSYYGGLQLGTDGRIYVARAPYGNASLSVIQNPKRKGAACNFTTNAMDLAGKKSRFGFPNFVQSYFDQPHFDVENVCFTDATNLILQNNSNIDDVTWRFTDGSSVTLNGLQPSYVFTGPGTYDIEVTETFGPNTYGPYYETVIIQALPPVDIGDTVYMHPGSPILLDAGAGYVSYKWQPTNENTQTVTISDPGLYNVTVKNDLCCEKVDSVLVLYFDVILPNAFRPGGSNGIFKAYASSLDAINNFSMYIYNRWGQQIFVSGDINQGWDGMIDGKNAPGDMYVWLVTYDVEKVGKIEKVSYKGNVLLLR